MIPLWQPVAVSAALFTIGLVGFLVRRNLIVVLMSLELMFNAVNINLVAFSQHLEDLHGQVFAIFVICVAAAEAAIGLSIFVILYRNRRIIDVDDMKLLRG